MAEQQVIDFVVGLVIGAVICLGKDFLMQRFFMKGSVFISVLLFVGRLVVDVAVMIAAALWSMAALLGMALGLVAPVAWITVRSLYGRPSSKSKR